MPTKQEFHCCIQNGVLIPHDYVEQEPYEADIAVSSDGFREIERRGLIFQDETVFRDAIIEVLKCRNCGAVSKGWSRGGFEE